MSSFYARRWRQLRDHLANIEPDAFRMDCWLAREGEPGCGTVGCLAGHAAMLALGHTAYSEVIHLVGWDDHDASDGWESVPNIAGKWLGLSKRDSDYVFLGTWTYTPIAQISRDEALAYLDHAIETRDPLASIRRRVSPMVTPADLVLAYQQRGLELPAPTPEQQRELDDLASSARDAVQSLTSLSPAARTALESAWDASGEAFLTLDQAISTLTVWRDHVTAVAAAIKPPIWDEARARELARELSEPDQLEGLRLRPLEPADALRMLFPDEPDRELEPA